MKYSKKLGPFSIYRVHQPREAKNFLDISLRSHEDRSWGWEWGRDASYDSPVLALIVVHLKVLYFERFNDGGFHLAILGFWWVK